VKGNLNIEEMSVSTVLLALLVPPMPRSHATTTYQRHFYKSKPSFSCMCSTCSHVQIFRTLSIL